MKCNQKKKNTSDLSQGVCLWAYLYILRWNRSHQNILLVDTSTSRATAFFSVGTTWAYSLFSRSMRRISWRLVNIRYGLVPIGEERKLLWHRRWAELRFSDLFVLRNLHKTRQERRQRSLRQHEPGLKLHVEDGVTGSIHIVTCLMHHVIITTTYLHLSSPWTTQGAFKRKAAFTHCCTRNEQARK